MRILVIDDYPDILGLAREVLESEDHEVVTRESLNDVRALDLINCSLILTDFWMPDYDGIQVAQCMRELLNGKCPEIICMSSMPEDQVNMQGWFDGYILKPFTVEGLLDFVAVFKGRTK